MSCNSCAKPFTLFRKEKGCPNCGFSYCSKCLDNKVFIEKLNSEAKVCAKCKQSTQSQEPRKIVPPDAYYKRLGLMTTDSTKPTMGERNPKDQEILDRLRQLKEDSKKATTGSTEAEIAARLQKIKGEMPSTSDAEIQARLAKLRGVHVSAVQSQTVLVAPDLRTEQEQANDLLKQYTEQTKIDGTYKDEFDGLVSDIESRLNKLKGAESSNVNRDKTCVDVESEDEEETVRKILEKVKAEASLEVDDLSPTNDELPFCEICNEDAKMRCLGCRYLFCKRCFLDHKDDDDGCNRYEPYTPPKGSQY